MLEGLYTAEVEFASGPAIVKMGMSERRVAEKEVIVLPGQTIEVNVDLNIDPHGSLVMSVIPNDAAASTIE